MATTYLLLSSTPPLTLQSHKAHSSIRAPPSVFSPSTNPKTTHQLAIRYPIKKHPRPQFIPHSKKTDSADGPDRLISAITYFYPFFDGIQYGKYLITQYPPFQILIQPLFPAIKAFKSFPFNGFLIFLTLYFVVVRNPNFSKYVRFNTMQAIVLDVLLIFPDLIERSWNPKGGIGLDLIMSFDSTVFLFLLVSLIYGSGCCAVGEVPRLPIVAEAAERQVP